MLILILSIILVQPVIARTELPVRLKIDRQHTIHPGMIDSRPAYQHDIFQKESRYLYRVNKLNQHKWSEIRPPSQAYNRRVLPKQEYKLFAPNRYFKYYHSQKLRNHYIRQIDRTHFQ